MARNRMDTFPRLTMQQLRAQVGNKTFNSLSSLNIALDGSQSVSLNLVRRPIRRDGNLQQCYLVCPGCGAACRVIRIVPQEPFLLCRLCVGKAYHARYLSQDHFYNLVRRYAENGHA